MKTGYFPAGAWIKLLLLQGRGKKNSWTKWATGISDAGKPNILPVMEWSFLLHPSFAPASVPALGEPRWGPKTPQKQREEPVVPLPENQSCQLRGWRIWGWLSECSELRRGLEECKLGLHKTLTHAEKSRVLRDSAEERAKPQAARRWRVNRNWGMLETSENQALAWGFFWSPATAPRRNRGPRSSVRGEKYGPSLFQGEPVWAFQLYPLERAA